MNPVAAVAISVATYLATFAFGIWYGLRWHHADVQALKRELRSSALQAAECYRRGYELGVDMAYKQLNPTYQEIDPEEARWSNN
jgi:hypothetical protein